MRFILGVTWVCIVMLNSSFAGWRDMEVLNNDNDCSYKVSVEVSSLSSPETVSSEEDVINTEPVILQGVFLLDLEKHPAQKLIVTVTTNDGYYIASMGFKDFAREELKSILECEKGDSIGRVPTPVKITIDNGMPVIEIYR